jgi:SAM-dependent methyltransferase
MWTTFDWGGLVDHSPRQTDPNPVGPWHAALAGPEPGAAVQHHVAGPRPADDRKILVETTYMDWDARYTRNPRPFGEEPTGFVHDVFNAPATYGVHGDPEHMHVLCPGDGYGRNGLWLAGLGYQVIGLELVQSAVEDAHARAREGNSASYLPLQADLSHTPFPLPQGSGFDLIVSAWVHLPTEPDRRRCNTECLRLLREGGSVVIVTGALVTSAEQEAGEWDPAMRWTDFSTPEEVRLIGSR